MCMESALVCKESALVCKESVQGECTTVLGECVGGQRRVADGHFSNLSMNGPALSLQSNTLPLKCATLVFHMCHTISLHFRTSFTLEWQCIVTLKQWNVPHLHWSPYSMYDYKLQLQIAITNCTFLCNWSVNHKVFCTAHMNQSVNLVLNKESTERAFCSILTWEF